MRPLPHPSVAPSARAPLPVGVRATRIVRIAVAAAFAVTLGGCAAKGATLGDEIAEAGARYESVGERWEEGQKQAAKGRKLKARGRERVEDGREDIERGERLIREGERMMEASRRDYERLKARAPAGAD